MKTFAERVAMERQYQVDRWGAEHDSYKGASDWAVLFALYLGKLSLAVLDRNDETIDRRCVQIAALAQAMWEARHP